MKEINENIWNIYKNYDAIVCPTNGVVKKNGELVMGGGLALQFKKRFPYIPFIWGQKVDLLGNHLSKYSHDKSDLPVLISFPSKHHWKDKSDINLIKRSLNELMKCVEEENYKKILLPKVGCGLGGLLWKDIKHIISEQLDDRYTVISNDDP